MPRSAPRRRLPGLILLASLVAACGGSGPENWDSGRPRIDWLRYLQQAPAAPRDLQFALSFADDDGDVGGGGLDLFLEGRRAGALSAAELFAAQTPPIAPDDTSGVLEFVLGLEAEPESGTLFSIGVELVDASGRRSNRPVLELRVVGQENGS